MGGIREVAKVACGLDVHRSEVVACLITSGTRKRPKVEIRRLTFTALQNLASSTPQK